MTRQNLIFLLLFMALAWACSTDEECRVDGDCSDGDSCTEDRCRLGRCSALRIPGCCHSDADCGPSFGPRCNTALERCFECLDAGDCADGLSCDPGRGICVAPQAGAACGSDADCVSGWCLSEGVSGYPGGFCGKACVTAEDCDSRACVDVVGGKSCLPICRGDADCRSAYLCLGVTPDRGACYPHCVSDTECPSVGQCNPWLGVCAGAIPGADNGAACNEDSDCKGFCATEADTGAPGGVCFSVCSAARMTCPLAHEACVWQLSPYLGALTVCQPVFDPAQGCRAEFAPMVAIAFAAGVDPAVVGTCQPACRSGDCLGTECNTWSGLCGDPAQGDEHGAACVDHDDCRGLCLSFWPDGYCTGPCHLSDPRCEDEAFCLNLGVQTSCTATCRIDADCRAGYFCEPDAHLCLPPP